DTDIAHALAALVGDKVGPALILVLNVGTMRPVQAATVGLHAVAGIEKIQTVKILQRVLAVAGQELVQCLGEQGTAIWRVGIFGTLLANFQPIKDFALDTQLAVGLLEVVVVQAAVDGLAGGIVLADVCGLAEERFFPFLAQHFGVVLDVGILDANHGELVKV